MVCNLFLSRTDHTSFLGRVFFAVCNENKNDGLTSIRYEGICFTSNFLPVIIFYSAMTKSVGMARIRILNGCTNKRVFVN